MKRILAIILAIVLTISLVGCTEATRVSENVSKEADNFNVIRRLTVLNARTDRPLFELVGAFSIEVDEYDNQLEVICETGANEYKKHFTGLNE